MGEADLVKTVPGFNAIVVRSATKITKPVIEAGKDLKLLVRAGIGLDNIDRVAAKEKGIAVANTPAATSISVAEHTFGLMLGAVRNHGKAILSMKQHKWEKKSPRRDGALRQDPRHHRLRPDRPWPSPSGPSPSA